MNKKIGFIGCGNMGKAMIAGIVDSGIVTPESIITSCRTAATLEHMAKEYGVVTTHSNREVVEASDFIFLAVKPQYYEEVIGEMKEAITEDKILISIAPGKSLAWLEEQTGKPCKVIRTMPNTPSMVKEGMMGICANERVSEEELGQLQAICNGFSMTEIVPEHLMDVVTAVSGSSPAYVYMFIEAMADAAVEGGMPRNQAYTFAAQAVLGSAKMVLETGIHPGKLKDNVCSPGGTTIQAVRVLEEKGMRGAVMDAMKACLDKARTI
jgi:pyrroline-5-carboxylate reductase